MEASRFDGVLGDFALDRTASTEGARLDLGDGRYVLVRQAGGHNRRYDHLVAMRSRERGVIELADELEQRLAWDRVCLEVAAEVLVAGWGGPGLEEIEFSPEAALELLEGHPAIFERVHAFAYAEENYRRSADTKSD